MGQVEKIRTMARYNRWQTENLYGAADRLSDADRGRDRGAFFGSIMATLNHILWADQIWMHRLAGFAKPAIERIPDSVHQFTDWNGLKTARAALDGAIIAWSERLDPAWLEGSLTYCSGAIGREVTRPLWLLVTHLFNHQTHHRGQVHCLLTQSGAKPGDTDLPFLDH